MARIKIGVVGCGLIAQMMHLPHLRELAEVFEVVALCDVSPATLKYVADHYGIQRRSSDYRDSCAGSFTRSSARWQDEKRDRPPSAPLPRAGGPRDRRRYEMTLLQRVVMVIGAALAASARARPHFALLALTPSDPSFIP